MFLLVFLVFFAITTEASYLSCRRFAQDFNWDLLYEANCDQRQAQEVEVKTHSENYEESGTCDTLNGELFSILETQAGCPAVSQEEVSRPVQVYVKIKAPCESYGIDGLSIPETVSVEVFGLFAIRLNLEDSKIEFRAYGQATFQTASNVTLHGTIYDDQNGVDAFHELLFDMQAESTLLYYNGLLLMWGRKMSESGKVKLAGGTADILNWVMIRDTTCSMECDSRYDCSGHGVTTDLDTSDGCECECDFNWFGDDCSKQTFIELGKDVTCDQPPKVTASGATFVSCLNFCASQNYTCNYFAFNDMRSICETFTECFIFNGISVPGSIVYQKRDMCKLHRDMIGSMYIELLDSSGYEESKIVLYLQYPSEGITLQSIEFQDANRDCAALGATCVGYDYWEELKIGCMTIQKSAFPTALYSPPDWNSFGFEVDGSILSSKLVAEFTQPVLFGGEYMDRTMTLVMPWMLELQTVLVLEASLGVENLCEPPCEGCFTCEAGECVPLTGDPCDDGKLSTWPDYCDQGRCKGTSLMCRLLTQEIQWVFDCLDGEADEIPVMTYSAGYAKSAYGVGLCLEEPFQNEYVLHGCSAQSMQSWGRPAKIEVKVRAPCHMWQEGTLASIIVTVYFVYAIKINTDGSLEIMLHGEEFIPIVSTKIDGTAFDDMTGEDSFHELVFDMRSRDVTYLYYNGRQIGESMTWATGGNIEIEGEWLTQVKVMDDTCVSSCDPVFDCSGHGTTRDGSPADGCDCDCDANYKGDDCSQKEYIDLGEQTTCGGTPYADERGFSFEECADFCQQSEDPECTYFTYDDVTEICELYEECVMEDSDNNAVPYQNRGICDLDLDVIGSMHIKMLISSTFAEDTLILYYQYPSSGIALDELSFLYPTDDKGHYRRWGTENPYWTAETLGCMTVMKGAFPMADVYDPPFLNSLGLQTDANTMTGYLVSKLSQDILFFGKVVQRRLEYESPFILVLQTILELTIDTGVKDVCDGSNCGQCRICGAGGACQSAYEGEPCDDNREMTYPDTCVDGRCVGVDLCRSQNCNPCEKCIVIADCSRGEPCAQCHKNPDMDKQSCSVDGSSVCIHGNCITPFDPECVDEGTCEEGCSTVCETISCTMQNGMENPCCHIGGCHQPDSTSPQCLGGSCTQTDSTDCSCDGGFCIQTGCTNPSCEGGGCIGNCDLMTPQTCMKCELGTFVPNNNATCYIPGYENVRCEDGECVGDDMRCDSILPCPPCHSCVAHEADAWCEIDESLDGTICLAPDVTCMSGTCIPPFQIVDSLVVNFGLQESDLSTRQAVITINGITNVRWPWKLIDHENFTVLSTPEFPVSSNSPLAISKDCNKVNNQGCTQEWSVTFTVNKICDTVSKYDLLLWADNWDSDTIGSAIWSVSVAQASVCGMVIQDAPLTGTIMLVDSHYRREVTSSSFPLDTTVYFKMETKGLAPITSVECLMLTLTILDTTHVLVGPSVDTDLLETLGTEITNTQDELTWPMFLDRAVFKEAVLTQIKLTITVRVTYYQQRRRQLYVVHYGRRALIQEEEPSFQFSRGLLVRGKECGIPWTFSPIQVGNHLEVDCTTPAGKSVFIMCTESGWEDHVPKCIGQQVEAPMQSNSMEDYMWHIIIAIICLIILAGALIYGKLLEQDEEGEAGRANGKLQRQSTPYRGQKAGSNSPQGQKGKARRSRGNSALDVNQAPSRGKKLHRNSTTPNRRNSRNNPRKKRNSRRQSAARQSKTGRKSRAESIRKSRNNCMPYRRSESGSVGRMSRSMSRRDSKSDHSSPRKSNSSKSKPEMMRKNSTRDSRHSDAEISPRSRKSTSEKSPRKRKSKSGRGSKYDLYE